MKYSQQPTANSQQPISFNPLQSPSISFFLSQSPSIYFLQSLSILILLASCKAPQVTTHTITKDSVIVREVPRIIEIPGQTIRSPSINLDSLVHLIQQGVKSETITNTLTYTDPDTRMQVGLLIDRLGNISAICEQQEKTIEIMEREIDRLRSISTTTEITHQPTFWQKLKGSMEIIAITIVITIIAMFILRRR